MNIPQHWLNLAAKIPWELPLPQDERDQPMTRGALNRIYTEECSRIELREDEYGLEPLIPIPEEVLTEYRKYRPTPLCRARGLEQRLKYPGRIYFKREDLNPTGSHKPNTAIPQAYYGRIQGLHELVTDTGAGQWGAALAWACHNMGLACTVFMTRNSFLSKPYRRFLMELSGARVIASPSEHTTQGRELLRIDPSHQGSLGIGMGEAMECIRDRSDARLALGCMSYYAALHQTVIGQELMEQCREEQIEPDILMGCVGGGTNFIGFVAPFVLELISKGASNRRMRLMAVESANIPVLTRGEYKYEHADAFGLTPRVKMFTLGRSFYPPKIHAGGLRYHGKSPILSLLVHEGIIEPLAICEEEAFRAGRIFFEAEGILPAPESSHAIAQVIAQADEESKNGHSPTIIFCLSGSGYLDLQGYAEAFGLEQ